MANLSMNNIFKEKFRADLENNKGNLFFEVKNQRLNNKEDYNGNITRLISCSENYYEDLIKVYSNNEYVLELDKDSKLDISGTGVLYLVVKEDIDLFLNFEDKSFSGVYVKMLIKKGLSVNVVEFSNCANLYKGMKIVVEDGSRCVYNQINLSSLVNNCKVLLDRGSNYDLSCVNYANSSDLFLLSEVVHLTEGSNSNMRIRNIVVNDSKIFSNGLIRIEQKARNSQAHQKIEGLILDDESSVFAQPIMEVENNEVKCSHGSSISQVPVEILYYLQSRGISKKEALKLIVKGYFEVVLNGVDDKIKIELEKKIEKSLI